MPARRKFFVSLLIAAAIFLFIPKKALAEVKIISCPSQIEVGQEFKVDVSLGGLTKSSHFLSIAIHKKSGDSYFGQTKSGESWIEADDTNCESFVLIEVANGAWDGALTGKVVWDEKDFNNSLGNYLLRIIKYTATSCSKTLSDEVTVELIASVSSTPTATPVPSPIPTTTSTVTTATYQINEVKNEDGNILSSVKVYVDGVYVHHYAPETLTFCDDCQCDGYVDCGFGEHTVKLEKSDYDDWSETKTFDAGDNHEINPVMVVSETSADPTPTPIKTPTPTLQPKKTTPTPTPTGSVLGEEEEATKAFFPWEATEEAEATQEATPAGKKRGLAILMMLAGFGLLFGAGFWVWYHFFKGEKT